MKPNIFSTSRLICSRCTAMAIPAQQPSIVPVAPISSPSIMKIFMILRAVAPMDFSMAMSLAFSMTVMISVVMILKAATSTMRLRMINITRFSSLSAEKRFLFISIQLRAQ